MITGYQELQQSATSSLADHLTNCHLGFSKLNTYFPTDKSDVIRHAVPYPVHKMTPMNDGGEIYSPTYKTFDTHLMMDGKETCMRVYVKSIASLDVEAYLYGAYPDLSSSLATIENKEKTKVLIDKLYDTKNSAYTETVACILVSSLRETNVSPHFPRLLGAFSAQCANHFVNFSDEYENHRKDVVFLEGLKNEQWRVVNQVSQRSLGLDSLKDDYNLFLSSSSSNNSIVEESESGSETAEFATLDDGDISEWEDNDESDDHESENDRSDDGKSSKFGFSRSTVSSCNFLPVHSDELDIEYFKSDDQSIGLLVTNEIQQLADLFMEDQECVNVPRRRRFSESSEECFGEKWLHLKNVPCQVLVMEAFPLVLEKELCHDRDQLIHCLDKMHQHTEENVDLQSKYFYKWLKIVRFRKFDQKWIAFTAQVCMALIAMQEQFNMIHNDLHTQNVLLETCETPFLFYKVDGQIFKIPTFGYIVKIIDYGRATYKIDGEMIMGDVFRAEGEAGEQFSYPGEDEVRNKNAVPNPSFDLCRFACSVFEDIFQEFLGRRRKFKSEMKCSCFFNLMKQWTLDDTGRDILRFKGFDLYKQIVRKVHHLVPKQLMTTNKLFSDFKSSSIDEHSSVFVIS